MYPRRHILQQLSINSSISTTRNNNTLHTIQSPQLIAIVIPPNCIREHLIPIKSTSFDMFKCFSPHGFIMWFITWQPAVHRSAAERISFFSLVDFELLNALCPERFGFL